MYQDLCIIAIKSFLWMMTVSILLKSWMILVILIIDAGSTLQDRGATKRETIARIIHECQY